MAQLPTPQPHQSADELPVYAFVGIVVVNFIAAYYLYNVRHTLPNGRSKTDETAGEQQGGTRVASKPWSWWVL